MIFLDFCEIPGKFIYLKNSRKIMNLQLTKNLFGQSNLRFGSKTLGFGAQLRQFRCEFVRLLDGSHCSWNLFETLVFKEGNRGKGTLIGNFFELSKLVPNIIRLNIIFLFFLQVGNHIFLTFLTQKLQIIIDIFEFFNVPK